MYETIKRLYKEHKIDNKSIQNAVKKEFITDKQAKDIMSESN